MPATYDQIVTLVLVVAVLTFIVAVATWYKDPLRGAARPLWLLIIVFLPVVRPIFYLIKGRSRGQT